MAEVGLLPFARVALQVCRAVLPRYRMGGEQLAEQLLRIRPEMSVLYMSGYPNDGIVRSGILAAGVVLLEKPFTREILTRRVRQVLDEQPEVS